MNRVEINLFSSSKGDSSVNIPKVVKGDHLASNISSLDYDLGNEHEMNF
jgi:hypothetical protein